MKEQDKDVERTFFDSIADKLDGLPTGQEQICAILTELNKHKIRLKGNMLECGCGTSGYSQYLVRVYRHLKATGVDLSPGTVKIANKTTEWAICGDVEDFYLFKKEQFDVITCLFFLHHLPSVRHALCNIDHWLRPGGILIIMDVNPKDIMKRISHTLRKLFEAMGGTTYLLTHCMATPNETIHEIDEYLAVLSRYEIITNKEVYIKSAMTFKHPVHIATRLFYKYMPICKYSKQQHLLILRKWGKNVYRNNHRT